MLFFARLFVIWGTCLLVVNMVSGNGWGLFWSLLCVVGGLGLYSMEETRRENALSLQVGIDRDKG